jgi:hypothetical protein
MSDEEPQFHTEFDHAILRAFDTAELWLSERDGVKVGWTGPASWLGSSQVVQGKLEVTSDDIRFRGLLRRAGGKLRELTEAFVEESAVVFVFADVPDPLRFVPEPLDLSLSLASGRRQVVLGPENLCRWVMNVRSF